MQRGVVEDSHRKQLGYRHMVRQLPRDLCLGRSLQHFQRHTGNLYLAMLEEDDTVTTTDTQLQGKAL